MRNGWLRASRGQVDGQRNRPSVGRRPGQPGDDAAVEQRSQESYAAARECGLAHRGLVVVPHQSRECGDRVAGAGDDIEDHRVVDPHPGLEGLGLGGDELVEGRLGPHDLPGGRLDLLDPLDLHRVVTGFGQAAGVLDQVLGGLHDHFTAGVVAGPSGPPGDLVELPGLEDPLAGPVELGELGEEHGPDRHVDADAEGVGAADDLEQAGLRELFHDAAISGEHPGVVNADSPAQQPSQRATETGGKAHTGQPLGDSGLLLLAEQLQGVEGAGVLSGRGLAGVDNVDRCPVGRDDLAQGVGQWLQAPRVGEGDRSLGRRHLCDLAAGAPGEVVGDAAHVAQGR